MSNKIEVEREVLIYAFRYSLGRTSFAPVTVMDNIKFNIKNLSDGDIRLFIKEILECDYFGMDMDLKEWLNFKDFLEKELKLRGVHNYD